MKRPIIISLLIVALGLVCTGILGVILFTANSRLSGNNPFDRRNISSQVEESKTLKVNAGKPVILNVFSESGGVAVTGADVDTVQVKAIKTAYDSSQARADAEVKIIKYTIEQSGNTITLRYELPKSMNFSNNVNRVDFIVTVPIETTVTTSTSNGEASVAGIKGNVDLQNDFGTITLNDIEGAVSVKTNSGEVTATSIEAGSADIILTSEFGAILLKEAKGNDINIDSNSGTITLDEVRATGKVTTQTDFGNTSLENSSADRLNIDTNGGSVSLKKVRVNREIKVDDEFGTIELEQVAGASHDLRTNSGSITVNGTEGKIKAHTEFGNIKVDNAHSATLDLSTNSGSVEFIGSLGEGSHILKTEFGGIALTLPADTKLNVDLSTEFGSIKSELPITVTLTGTSDSNGDQIVGTINGGGDLLTAETNSGGINIYESR